MLAKRDARTSISQSAADGGEPFGGRGGRRPGAHGRSVGAGRLSARGGGGGCRVSWTGKGRGLPVTLARGGWTGAGVRAVYVAVGGWSASMGVWTLSVGAAPSVPTAAGANDAEGAAMLQLRDNPEVVAGSWLRSSPSAMSASKLRGRMVCASP